MSFFLIPDDQPWDQDGSAMLIDLNKDELF
jgi:hypothetical protein